MFEVWGGVAPLRRSAAATPRLRPRPQQASAGNNQAFHLTLFLRMKIDKQTRNSLSEYIRIDCPYGLCWTMQHLFPTLCGRPFPTDRSFVIRYENRQVRTECYRIFSIPKKSGGERLIQAPERDLRDIQRCILFILSEIWVSGPCVHGFANGRSVVSGASEHVGQNYVFNADIKDFFPSITLRRVRSALMRIGIPPKTASFISELATAPSLVRPDVAADIDRFVLPQGAPSSPILSNIVCEKLDARLMGLAKRFGLKYTRYADDMTFSSPHNVYQEGSEFRTELLEILSDNGFTPNPAKTHLMKRGARQEVTGLTVSSKVNVSRHWIKALRAEIHRYEKKDPSIEMTPEVYKRLLGKVQWVHMVRGCDDRTNNLLQRVHHLMPLEIPIEEDSYGEQM